MAGNPQCCFTSLPSQHFFTQDCQHGTVTSKKLAPHLFSLGRAAAVVQTWRCAVHVCICHETDAGENPPLHCRSFPSSINPLRNSSKSSPHSDSSSWSEIIFCCSCSSYYFLRTFSFTKSLNGAERWNRVQYRVCVYYHCQRQNNRREWTWSYSFQSERCWSCWISGLCYLWYDSDKRPSLIELSLTVITVLFGKCEE